MGQAGAARNRARPAVTLRRAVHVAEAMSTQISSERDQQAKYIDPKDAGRQIRDEVKHGQLHADVLLRGGWINAKN
jgi:hypothetical protein